MKLTPYKLVLFIGVLFLSKGSFLARNAYAEFNTPGEKGAKVYCYMRKSGIGHESSWNAAYALIKRQTNSLFKTSPKHGAVMIIEAVVEEPKNYPNCGQYLGELFGGSTKEKNENINSDGFENENRYRY